MFPYIIILIISVCCSQFVSSVPAYTELYYSQRVDHFNFDWETYRQDTFRQRYLVQDVWWSPGKGPIFFYTGNEGDITSFWNNTGFMFDIAPQFKALVVFAEHRFYGKSIPFGEDVSYRHPYIDLLTAEQALADYAELITDIKIQFNASNCPVIAFGGSYGGMLSAYLRFRYPNIVLGSIAASAPIFVVANESPREQFFQDVTKDFDDAMAGCKNRVIRAFDAITLLFAGGPTGLQNVSQALNMCHTLEVEDYDHLVAWLRNAFTVLAMMDYPYATSFIAPLPANPVKEACNRILSTDNPVTGISKITELVYGDNMCHDLDLEYIECADPTGCGLGTDSLAWDYQVCTEFIMPAGSNNVTDMFPPLPFTLSHRHDYCKKRWDVTPRNNWAKISFWGKDISSASNIVFSNGLLDPWARGGVMSNISDTLISVIINEGAHHLDLRGTNAADPESVIVARQLEVHYIQSWIKTAYVSSLK